MTSEARLILKHPVRAERWEDQEREDYSMDSFRSEFRERLYSKEGRKTLKSDAADSNHRD
jgi:hypothetical protein